MRSLIVFMVIIGAIVGVIAAMALLLGGLSSTRNEDRTDLQPLTIVAANGTTARLDVEIADTDELRSQGLSGREEVPAGTGMLFVLPRRVPGFWMKDTTVPLSIAFMEDCGQIIDIQDMEPLSLEIHRPGSQPFGFALETPQGWFETNGIAAGDIVSLPRDLRPEHC